MTTQNFIDALSRINFTHTHGSTEHISLRSDDGFEVSYSVRLATFTKDLPLQMIMQLRYNDSHIMSIGAETEADNKSLVDWYVQARERARRAEVTAEKDVTREGYIKFMEHVESVYEKVD
jgi:hypothetical protein